MRRGDTSIDIQLRTLPWWTVSAATRLVRITVLVGLFLLAVPWLFGFFDDAGSYTWVQSLYGGHYYLMEQLGEPVQAVLPTRVAGEDRTAWYLAFAFLVISIVASSIGARARRQAEVAPTKRAVEEWKKEMGIEEGSAAARELEEQVEEMERTGAKSREELLKIFAETKRKLEGMGREFAFLSIDVVGSTEMKEDEDPAAAQYDFGEYRKLVERVFNARGVVKAAWTPDGVMAAFSDVDTAVKAGKDVINSLEHFNREVKLMKTDFAVRCGVNAGFVYLDDSVPLEAVSDRAIDIAGHMQKYAEPNTVAVAKKIAEPLADRAGFVNTIRVVDGYEVFAWRPADEEASAAAEGTAGDGVGEGGGESPPEEEEAGARGD